MYIWSPGRGFAGFPFLTFVLPTRRNTLTKMQGRLGPCRAKASGSTSRDSLFFFFEIIAKATNHVTDAFARWGRNGREKSIQSIIRPNFPRVILFTSVNHQHASMDVTIAFPGQTCKPFLIRLQLRKQRPKSSTKIDGQSRSGIPIVDCSKTTTIANWIKSHR